MVKVDDLIRLIRNEELENTVKSQILRYFVERPDEAFRKIDLTREFRKRNVPSTTVRTLIGQLWKEDKIGRYHLPDKGFSYYGTHEAIRKLDEGLPRKSTRSEKYR
jgi:hypothetical protein